MILYSITRASGALFVGLCVVWPFFRLCCSGGFVAIFHFLRTCSLLGEVIFLPLELAMSSCHGSPSCSCCTTSGSFVRSSTAFFVAQSPSACVASSHHHTCSERFQNHTARRTQDCSPRGVLLRRETKGLLASVCQERRKRAAGRLLNRLIF